MNETEVGKLYSALVGKGYSTEDIGSEEIFRSKMADKDNRKLLYDWVSANGDFKIGDYDTYESRLTQVQKKPERQSPYSVAPADYTQKTEAQKNYEERGDFEPKGQGTVNLNGLEVPVFIGDEGQFRVPSPVKLDEQQEIFRHGNPSEAEQREEQERSYRNFVQSNRAKMDETDKRLSERMGEMTKQYFNDYKGVLQSDAMGEPAYMTALKGNRDYQNLRAAHNLIEDARKREKQVRRADDGFLTNTFRSMGETAIDERTWDLGARDMTDAISIYNAVQKDEKGEELTDSERILLDAFEGNALVMAQNKHRGESGGELAGAMTVEMIPFIAQIVANPLAKLGEATSKGAAKAISNWLYKRTKDMANKTARKAVRSAARGAVKFGAGLPADLAGGMGVAVTSNVMNTTADVYDRMLKGDSAGEAIAKGITSQGIEFASENAGRFFEPFFGGLGKVLGKGAEYGLNKVGAGSVVNLAKDYAKKAYTPAVKEFMDKTQWSGFLGEYGEELVGGVENALLVGDQTVSEVFSKDNLFDTAVGLSVASVLFPAIGTVNYGVEKGRQRKAVKEAEKIASGILKDRWPQFKAAINGAKNSDELGKTIEEIYKKEGKEYSDNKETQALFDYARSYYAYNALKGVDPNNVAYESELISAVRDNYQAGATMTAEELDNTRMDVNRIGVDLMRLTGMTEDELNDMDTAAVTQRINEAEENGDMDIADKWREFMNGSAAMSGKIKAVDDAINEQSAASDAEVDAITNGDGMIVLGTTRGGEQVYIIGGNVALNGDNSVNKEGSSAQLTVVRDGKRTTMGIVELESVDAPIDAAGEKVSRRTAIEENLRRQQRIDMGEEHVFTPGEKFETLQGEVQFVADRGDGTADVTVNGNATVVDMGTLNEQFNTAKQMEYNARKAEETSQAQTVQAEVPQPVNDEQVTSETTSEVAQSALQRVPKDEQGEPIYEQVDSDTAWDAIVEQTEGDEAMAQTVADGMVADKEAALKKLEKAKAKGGATIAEKIAAEKERMAAIEAAKAELAKWKEIAGVAASRKATPDINDASETETVATEGTKPTESVEVPAVEDVQPTNEMQPAEVETKHIGESTEMVGTVPSEAENPTEPTKKAEQSIETVYKRKRQKPAGRYLKEDAKLGDYLDFEDYVMREIATGGVKFIWGNSTNSKTKGLAAHLGLRGNSERMRRIWMLDNKNGGYPEIVAYDLLSGYASLFGNGMPEEVTGMTDIDALDVLLEVLGAYDSPRAMFEAAQKRHNAIEDPYYDISEEEIEAMAMHMSLDEWEAYQEYLMAETEFIFNNVSDEELYSIFAEEYLTQDYERSRENAELQQRILERQGRESGNAESNTVLQGEQLNNAGENKRGETAGPERNDVPVEQGAVDVPEASVFENAEVERASQAEDAKTEEVKSAKIEDIGEKIGGAKKDKLRETIDRMKADMEQSDETLIDKIAKLPISKIFNFDFQKLREGGMPNEAISFMEIVKKSIPAKPRTSHKVRRWVNNTLALYKLCLEVGTNWDRVNTILTSRDFAGTELKALFDAYMSVGGFDSGLNIGNAKLKQLDKTAGYYKDGKFVSSEGKWYVRDAGKHGGIYDTKEEAVEALKAFAGDNAGTTESGKKKEVKFAVYQRREDKSIFIAIKGKSDIVIQDGFKSAKEAFDYIEANNAELQSRYRNLLDKTNADFEENRERKGRDFRNGKDITAEEFRTTFGFRGVEFGNWMTQEDRRKAINECYDALMDLAAVCKVSPKALSLNGTLGMAFGSRGGGKFSAHYEPGKVVINLTKTRGAGTLAHEWFHAIDNYFAKMGETEFGYATGGEGMLPKGIQKYGKRYYDRNSGRVITEEEYNELAKEHTVRKEMVDAWEHLMESLKNSDYYKRSNAYARLHNSKYWNDPTELGARAFSVWVENELSKQDTSNDYLANNPRYVKSEVTDAQDKYMPYPFDTDADWMDEAFGNLFEVMQERETEDGNVALYQRGSLSLDTENPAFEAATKNTIDAVKKAGVEVVEATPEMVQAVLGAEMMSVNERLLRLDKVSKVVSNWLKNNVRGRSIKVELPVATQRKIRAKMGRDFGSHVITANNVAHSKKNHGENGIKNTENSIPLRDEDFALMPYIMVSPSYVERGSFDSVGSESVRFYKVLSNGYVVVVEKEQKNSPNDMETITMWAELSANVPNARNMRPSKSTSETVTISPDDAAKIRKDAENAIRADVKLEKSTAAAPFYSNAKKAVLDIKQEKATPQQWVAMLKKNGGLKAGEDAWVGLEAWLNEQSGSVTKQQILDYIDENAIQIEEVQYSQFGYGMIDEAANNLEAETKAIGWDAMKEKYPGIEEYFEYDNGEILWSEARASVGEYEDFILDNRIVDVNPSDEAINETREKYTTEGLKRKREIALVVPTIESWNESDEVHFGDAGNGRAVAWVRFGETTDSEGKRVLVIDEIQSKRHQEGREKGYAASREELGMALENFQAFNQEMRLKYGENALPADWSAEDIAEFNRLRDRHSELSRGFDKGIPAAPFEKNWHELAMKRMLRYAAENGFDKVAWTTGKQQAERYNLSRDVDLIQSVDNNMEVFSDGTPVAKDVRILTTVGSTINFKVGADGFIHGGEFAGKNVTEVFGKELGERIMAPGTNTIEEDGLKIGGEGMKGFYDRMLPSFVQKYTKKWGAKVGEVTMPSLKQNNTMWSVDVTPQMTEEVMRGQPMFLRTEDGTVYGWAVNGKIFLTPEGMNPNTPAHEYTHLWAAMVEKNDPKLWSRIVEAMKESPIWNEVLLDEAYRDIHNNDSRMASEVLSRLSGEENYRRAMEQAEQEIKAADGIIEKAKKIALWGRIKEALADFWTSVKGVFGFNDKAPWTEFVNMALGDLYAGVNPNAEGSPLERMFIGEKGAANLDKAEEDINFRSGEGAYSDEEVAVESDPVSKVLGKPRFTRKLRREFAERERMRKAVDDVASALNTPIEVLESTEGLTGRRAKAKGWYEKSTGKIVVVLPNNRSVTDVMQTVLHEAVAHHGLRKLFGSGFDNFIDNIYNNVDAETRQKINLLASRNGWNLKVATEEYLASLAEDANFERVNPSIWQRIKSFFLDMLAEAGVRLDIELSDNELRYILWRSYQNLKYPGRYRTIVDEARDIAKQGELKVGNYADNGTADVNVAEESDAGMVIGKENSISLPNNLKSKEDVNDRKTLPAARGARAFIERNAWVVQRDGRAEKPTQEVEKIIRDFNRDKTVYARTPLQHQTLALLRVLTNNEIDDIHDALEVLSTKVKDAEQRKEYGEALEVVKRFKNRNERGTIIRDLTGADLGEEIPLAKIDELFEMYNSDVKTAELYKRVRPFAEELGITFVFDELEQDEQGGIYTPSDNSIVYNAHMLYAPYVSQQRKASTIVHEMIHAVTVFAISAKKNNIKLSPKLEKAAQTINDIYDNVVKGNPLLVHEEYNAKTDKMEPVADYGASSAYEMISELSNPEFVEKLKQIEYDGRSVWQRIWDAIKSIFVGKNETPSVYEQLSDAFDTIVENFDREAYERTKEDGYKFFNMISDIAEQEDDVLFRSDSELAIENYNKRVLESGYQVQEALQDSMLALKEAQEAIVKETGKAMRDEENAYMAENALSSVNTAEAAEYKRAFYQPLVDEVATVGKKMGYEATYDYLMAKHGIERNREMSVKEALKVKGVVDKAKYESWKSERNDTIADAKNNGLSWEETQRKLDALAGNYGATIRDYSGLSSIYGDNFAEKAYSAVKDFENNVDTKALWARIKAANNATLMKLYNSSILDEETFAQISGMYEYYIPLRGFDEKTVEDVYAYVAQDTGRMGSVMKIARGRNSKAENPIAFIGQMAEQAITQGNRNRVKLKFLNFALSHMTSLLTVTRDVYLRREGEDWIVVTPKEAIDKLNNPTPDQIAEAVQKWQEDMNEKVKGSPKDFKKVDAREGIPYKMPNKDLLSEHQVFVKRAGKTFVITVNGSPRLAQALNGLTNPDQGTGIKLIDEKANAINRINRMLSNVYTTKNINFVASNFVRDIVYTNSMVWVKESPKYAMKFHKNCLKYNPAYMMRLFSKLENGTLDMSNEDEKLFMEFYKNGGETGYTQIKDIEAKKKELKKMLAKADRKGLSGIKSDPLGKGKDGFDAIGDFLDYVNRSVENVARFAAYKTSREMGRSVSKSIWDAKEISVNFNKKGAGGKFYKANGQTLLGSIAAAVSGTGMGTYVFWNASVQGMYNIAKNAKENPTKALGMAASVFALGVLVSMFAGDDDEYMALPEYIRRNNICFKLPLMDKDSWVTISLPIEYRALYGAGEYLTNICTGKEEFEALKAGELISQLLPIDVLEGGGGLNAFMPTLVKPIWSAYIVNESWTGLPVWKDSPFDTENVPQYKRVYRNTSPALVSFTKMLNQFSGGDEHKAGWIDINPAKLEHVLEGYLGGYATMARQVANLVSGIKGDEDYSFDPKDVPIASRVWKYADRERGSSGVKNKFYEYKKNHEVVKAQLKGYAKDAVDPKRTEEDRKYSAERVKEIQKSDAFKAMQVYEAFKKALDNARKMVKEDDTKENRRREAMLMEQVNKEIEKVLNE